MAKNNKDKFIQENSLDGGFLQSEWWRRFQQNFGRKAFYIEKENILTNVIEHKLPLVGKYYYLPRGPVVAFSDYKNKMGDFFCALLELAKKNKIGWIRIEPQNENILQEIKKVVGHKIYKSFRDIQPKEILIIDITKTEDLLLAEMKSKTRYNIKVAQRQGVLIKSINRNEENFEKYFNEFLKLIEITSRRKKISFHPKIYYRKMFETIPKEILKLYVAEYKGKVIVANAVVFFGKTATYIHGASDDKYRNVMAPYFLQWRQIQDAKNMGCSKYDFGGVSANYKSKTKKLIASDLEGITRFKIGFSPKTAILVFPGSYDIVINLSKYYLYRFIQKIKF